MHTIYLFKGKRNCTKYSEKMVKYIEIIILKFKTNAINTKKDVNIYTKYFFLTAHASIAIFFSFQNFIKCSMQQVTIKTNQIS